MRHYKTVQLLDLAKALAGSAEGITLDEMAILIKVDRRTAERMRDALRIIFPQLEELTDGRQKRFRISGGLDGFVQAPTPDELAELDAAIAVLESAGASARAATLRSLARKIACAQRPSVRRRLDPDVSALTEAQVPVHVAGIRPIVHAENLARLREAILAGRRVMLTYRSASGEASGRIIEPYGFLWGKAYYLVGPEVGKSEPVLWRMDRMMDIALDEPFAGAPADFSLVEFAERSFGAFQEKPRRIRLRFDADVAEAAEQFLFHRTQKMKRSVDGTLEVTFVAGGLLEIARHVMTWGGKAEVLEPAELRQILVDEIEAVAVRHRSQGMILASESACR